MKRKHVYLTDRHVRLLDELSEETGLSVSDIVRRALDAYLDDMKSDPPPSSDFEDDLPF